ncbi:MAG: helix-turn-helix domain-containing protein [Lachnospiraceae bacterium]|nr:helix-turn-helix domain-containing protein [Lachnospiraceae bacterium]
MNYIAHNLKTIIEERRKEGETIEEISKKSKISKKTLYDIMAGKVTPRKATITLLEEYFELKNGGLSVSHEYFDSDYFLEQLEKVYEPIEIEDCAKYHDPSWDGELDYYTLEEALIIECGMKPESLFKHEMPDDATQERVSSYFKIDKEKLFKPISRLGFSAIYTKQSPLADASKLNILSRATVDESKMIAMFKDIRDEYKKVIYNTICDFYVLTHQLDDMFKP